MLDTRRRAQHRHSVFDTWEQGYRHTARSTTTTLPLIAPKPPDPRPQSTRKPSSRHPQTMRTPSDLHPQSARTPSDPRPQSTHNPPDPNPQSTRTPLRSSAVGAHPFRHTPAIGAHSLRPPPKRPLQSPSPYVSRFSHGSSDTVRLPIPRDEQQRESSNENFQNAATRI